MSNTMGAVTPAAGSIRRRHHRAASGVALIVVAAFIVLSSSPASAGTGTASGFATFGHFRCGRVSTGSDSIHTDCYVTDDAKDGKGVYLQVQGVRDWEPDTSWWRHTPNVTPGYPSTNHFIKDQYSYWGGIDRWRIRVCLSVADATDPCSGYGTVGV